MSSTTSTMCADEPCLVLVSKDGVRIPVPVRVAAANDTPQPHQSVLLHDLCHESGQGGELDYANHLVDGDEEEDGTKQVFETAVLQDVAAFLIRHEDKPMTVFNRIENPTMLTKNDLTEEDYRLLFESGIEHVHKLCVAAEFFGIPALLGMTENRIVNEILDAHYGGKLEEYMSAFKASPGTECMEVE